MKKYRHILLLLTLNAVYSLPCFGIFLIDDVDATSHVRQYNALPSLKHADADLRSRSNFQDFLSNANKIVVSHDLENLVGLRLIHRHFALGQEQVMVENFEIYDEHPSLVTSTHHIAAAREKAASPSSWILNGSELCAFEFSTDQAVRDGIKRMRENTLFLSQMRELIKENQLESLMAIAILKRDGLRIEMGQEYREFNYGGVQKQSVVMADIPHYDSDIRTSWSFGNEATDGRCVIRTWCSPSPPLHSDFEGHFNVP